MRNWVKSCAALVVAAGLVQVALAGGSTQVPAGYPGSDYVGFESVQGPQASGCLELDMNLGRGAYSNIGETDRSVAVDINSQVSVNAMGIVYQSGADHDLLCIIREVNGNVRGNELAREQIFVPAGGGMEYHDVPINFTFQPGTRYDIAFQAVPDWGFNVHSMELLNFNNPNLDPNQGFDVGPFKVLDGGADRASGYSNFLMPRVQVCEGGAGCVYTIKKSAGKKGCQTCPERGADLRTQIECEDVNDCDKKVKTRLSCPGGGNGFCKVKGKRSSCGG